MGSGGPDWVTSTRTLESAKDTGKYGQVTINTVATLIRPADSGRQSCTLTNQSDKDVYLGLDNLVTVNTGMAFAAFSILVNARYTGPLYGIVASGSGKVGYIDF